MTDKPVLCMACQKPLVQEDDEVDGDGVRWHVWACRACSGEVKRKMPARMQDPLPLLMPED
jgi:hypothetical protein